MYPTGQHVLKFLCKRIAQSVSRGSQKVTFVRVGGIIFLVIFELP
jgi:GGDEF domain-containing protein